MDKNWKNDFYMNWQSGSMEINIKKYFSAVNKTTLVKFLKLVKQCSKEQQDDLLERIYNRRQECDDVITAQAELRKKSEELLSSYIGSEIKLSLSPTEKAIIKERGNYAYGIAFLTKER